MFPRNVLCCATLIALISAGHSENIQLTFSGSQK